ncbi:MAG: DUF2807 domain-containing protein [Chloroflexi bacterium]|nr:DUF2807 domain-containing protein [Chloroflexota bacterium]MDA1145581.1 DUF2807 domain-containing protein [Chloroflexota bacterium]
MSTAVRWLLAPLAALLLVGCISVEVDGRPWNGEHGSGFLVTETRGLSDFTSLRVSAALRVEVTNGPPAVEIHFDDNLIGRVEATVRAGQLRLTCSDCSPSTGALIRVTTHALTTLDVGGASRVTLRGLDAPRFDLILSGASLAIIDGAVEALSIEGSGASRLDGVNLVTSALQLDLSGATQVDLQVTTRVTGELSGASRLNFTGSPPALIEVDTSGASSIER